MDEDDQIAIGFARVKFQNDRLYEMLTPEMRAYTEQLAGEMLGAAPPEQGLRPHHGAIALMAWLNKCDALDDEAVKEAIVFCTAMERWEQARAGS